MNYYLIGKNIQTSLSPRIHNYLFNLKQKKYHYHPPISNRLFSIVEMQQASFGGLSVTIPYKKYYANQIHIKKQGSISTKHNIINTIYKDQNKQLIATNTDIFGIRQCFEDYLAKLQYNNALIIGAGATAQIFCSFFQQNNCKVSFLNRSTDKSNINNNFNNIIDILPLRATFQQVKKVQLYSTIINTLPSQAIYQNWDLIQANLMNLLQFYKVNSKARIIYMNVNYRDKLDPIQQFLKRSLSISTTTLKGIDMLLWQAIEQNRYFCGQKQHDQQYSKWLFAKLRTQLLL